MTIIEKLQNEYDGFTEEQKQHFDIVYIGIKDFDTMVYEQYCMDLATTVCVEGCLETYFEPLSLWHFEIRCSFLNSIERITWCNKQSPLMGEMERVVLLRKAAYFHSLTAASVPKFKVGDRVSCEDDFNIKHEGTITAVGTNPLHKDCCDVLWDDGFSNLIYEGDLTLIQPATTYMPIEITEEDQRMAEKLMATEGFRAPCDHAWAAYTGLFESFEHCSKCGERRK